MATPPTLALPGYSAGNLTIRGSGLPNRQYVLEAADHLNPTTGGN
jgi:hypothetical protein